MRAAPEDFAPIDSETEEEAKQRSAPVPEPLRPRRRPARFPAEVLPGWLAAYVEAVAEATQTPVDLAGCCVLGVVAACAGGRAVVEARPGWREPTNVFLLPVLPPGSRKSSVISMTTKPLTEAERHLVDQVKATIGEAETLREIAVKAAEKARRDAAQVDGVDRTNRTADAVSAAAQADAVEVPTLPRLIADDVTPEAAASLLADQDGRIAIMSAEGGIFETMAGRYSKGVPVLDVWLKGHAGRGRIQRRRQPWLSRSDAQRRVRNGGPTVLPAGRERCPAPHPRRRGRRRALALREARNVRVREATGPLRTWR